MKTDAQATPFSKPLLTREASATPFSKPLGARLSGTRLFLKHVAWILARHRPYKKQKALFFAWLVTFFKRITSASVAMIFSKKVPFSLMRAWLAGAMLALFGLWLALI